MESRPTLPDRKLLARLVLVREEARNMMGGGLLDERNDRGLSTLPEAEVCFGLVCFNILYVDIATNYDLGLLILIKLLHVSATVYVDIATNYDPEAAVHSLKV